MSISTEAGLRGLAGCYRSPSWPWYMQPLPWWTALFLVPLYSTCSSIANLQAIRSWQLPVMVIFSCAAYTANRVANQFISDRGDIVSASGAFVIGLCGNIYSRVVGGTAFTAMVTGVLFLVPVSCAWNSDIRRERGTTLLTMHYVSSPLSETAVASSRTTAVRLRGTRAVSSLVSV